MSFSIRDGSGNKYIAKVNSEQKLLTESTTIFQEEDKAREGNSFVLYGKCHLAAAASGGLLYIKNTSSTKNISISRVFYDAHILTTDIEMHQIINPTSVASGTDVSSTNIINKCFSSPITLDAQLVVSDASADMTFIGGTTMHDFTISSKQSTQRDMRGTNILSNGDIWLLAYAGLGANTIDAEIVSISVNCYTYNV